MLGQTRLFQNVIPPMAQAPNNMNNMLVNKQQLVYQMKVPVNQIQIKNTQVQNVQPLQNVKLRQTQIIKSPNSQGNINTNVIPKQVVLNQGFRKTYTPGQLRVTLNNQAIPPNQMVIKQPNQTIPPNQMLIRQSSQTIPPNQVIIKQPNQIPEQLIKNQNLLTSSYLNANQTLTTHIHNYQNPQLIQQQNLDNSIYIQMPNDSGTQNYNQDQKDPLNKSTSSMTLGSLAKIDYKEYPQAELSSERFFNISGYASNSYNGKIKNYNEDMTKIIVDYYKNNSIINNVGYRYYPNVSYFGVFDGHGGDKCSKFLQEKLDKILFNTPTFPYSPLESIRDAFIKAENEFKQIAIQNNKLVDRSGSCALIALIIDDYLYAINLGDSRGLYSRDGGKKFYQITRDHKPNDEKEKRRIEMNGGKIYYANNTVINGVKVQLKEEQFGKGFKFPYRLEPSGLAVSFII